MSVKRPSPIDRRLGARLRAMRRSRGMTQTALGTALGVSFTQVQKYERGKDRISVSRLFQIAKALDAEVESLLEGVG